MIWYDATYASLLPTTHNTLIMHFTSQLAKAHTYKTLVSGESVSEREGEVRRRRLQLSNWIGSTEGSRESFVVSARFPIYTGGERRKREEKTDNNASLFSVSCFFSFFSFFLFSHAPYFSLSFFSPSFFFWFSHSSPFQRRYSRDLHIFLYLLYSLSNKYVFYVCQLTLCSKKNKNVRYFLLPFTFIFVINTFYIFLTVLRIFIP